MENDFRNEVEIQLAGETRTMRASFPAIMAIEKALSKSMMAIIGQVASGDLSFTDAAIIVFHGLRGNDDKRLSFDEVGQSIVDAGLGNISMSVVNFVSSSLKGVSMGKPEGQTPQ